MVTKEEAKQKIVEFLELYHKHLADGRFEDQNESNTEHYIEDLFERLGWDRYDLERQHNAKEGRVDYSVNLERRPYFFIEVKKHKVQDLNPHRNQAIGYGWQASTKWAVLTNLREIRVYNCQYKGSPEEIIRLFPPIKIEDLLSRFEDLWLLSKNAADENLLEQRAIATSKVKIKEPISVLTESLLEWRTLLTKEMKSHPRLNEISGKDKEAVEVWVDEAVQMLLNRFIFLRTVEDLGNWSFSLRNRANEWREKKKEPLMSIISKFFRDVDAKYNAGLFAKHPCEDLTLSDAVLEKVIESMYLDKENDVEWDFKILISNNDILGLAYEQYLGVTLTEKTAKIKKSKEKRKRMGIYYTPKYIVEYIVQNTLGEKLKNCKTVEDILNIKVVDPACGSGSFLKEAYRTFKEEIKKRGWGNQRYLDKSGEQMSVYDAILKNCIYGVDLDKKACEMAKLNLLIMAAEGGTHQLPNIDKSIQQGNSLIDDPQIVGLRLAFKWEERFPEVFNRENPGFDVVIGNPPYVRPENVPRPEREYYLTSKRYNKFFGRFDIYILFIEKSLKLLNSAARFSFIVPVSFLNQNYSKILREWILKEFRINKILDLSEIKVFEAAQVNTCIVVIQKTNPTKNNLAEIMKPNEISTIHQLEYISLPQSIFLDVPQNMIRTDLNDNKLKIINKIQNKTIKTSQIFYVVIGSVPHDSKTGASKDRLISDKKLGDSFKPYLEGKDVSRYTIESRGVYLNYQPRLMHRPKFPELFENDKLIVRNISTREGLLAVYDNKNYYTNDTVSLCVPWFKLTELNIKGETITSEMVELSRNYDILYCLGLINSKLINFYFKQILSSNLHVYPEAIRNLPIKNGSRTQQQCVIQLVDKILTLNKRLKDTPDQNSNEFQRLKEERDKTDAEIDRLVFELYGLTEEEIKIVEESLKK